MASAASIVIGRFQPFHLGHLDLVLEAFNRTTNVGIVIGSVQESRTPRNPFTFEERKDMIMQSLTPAERGRVEFFGIRDYNDDDRWRTEVVNQVTHYFDVDKYFLVGNNKDDSTYYLGMFASWEFVQIQPRHVIDGTQIRKSYFLDSWQKMVPSGVISYLNSFEGTHEFWKLQGQFEP